MMPDSRQPSARHLVSFPIDISRLERESRGHLYFGLIIGIAIHALVIFLIPYNPTVQTSVKKYAIPIAGDIIALPPNVMNPYNTWQHAPEPRTYEQQRSSAPTLPETSSSSGQRYEAPSDRYRTGTQAQALIEEQVTGAMDDTLAAIEYQLRGPQYDIPLSNPLFIDTGEYKAEIIFNPNDKTAIQGYVHFGIAWGRNLKPPDSLRQSIQHLAEALRTHTNIVATADRQVMLSPVSSKLSIDALHSARSAAEQANYLADYTSRGPKLSEYPFLFMTTDSRFTLTENESKKLRDYVNGSGFLLIDNGAAGYDDGRIHNDILDTIRQALLPPEDYPQDAPGIYPNIWFTSLNSAHPLFHAFFDFPDGAPPSTERPPAAPSQSIIGIYFGGGGWGQLQMIGIYTPQGYTRSWQDSKNTEQLKMGVNLVVYALTRYKEAIAADGTSELLSDRRELRR